MMKIKLKAIVKYTLSILIITGACLTFSRAQSTNPGSESIRNSGIERSQRVTLLNRIRVRLAAIAGKLMSNSFIYGEFLHLDRYLWQMWNIAKNFANFTLAFIFIVRILRAIFTPDDSKQGPQNIAKKIGYMLIAGIGIQASWFVVGAVIDIERVATSAIASLPSVIIAQNSTIRSNIINSPLGTDIYQEITLKTDASNPTSNFIIETTPNASAPTDPDVIFDAIAPRYDNMNGPLIFIGMGVLQIQRYHLSTITSNPNRGDIAIDVIIKLVIAAFFTIMLLLLIIVNVFRIVLLRVVIAFAPFIVLFMVLKEIMGRGNIEEKIPIPISINKILGLIFQPTIVTAFISLGMIVLVSMYAATQSGKIGEITQANQTCLAENFCFSMNGLSFTIRDIILRILAIFLLAALVRISAKSLGDKGIIASIVKKAGALPGQFAFFPIINRAKVVGDAIEKSTGLNLNPTNLRSGITFDNKARQALGLGNNNHNYNTERKYIQAIENVNTQTAGSGTEFLHITQSRYQTFNKGNFTKIYNNTQRKKKFIELINRNEIPFDKPANTTANTNNIDTLMTNKNKKTLQEAIVGPQNDLADFKDIGTPPATTNNTTP